MRRHGATVVGTSLKELVSRSIFLCQNAEYQMRAYLLGAPTPLRPGEIKLAGAINADAVGGRRGPGNIGACGSKRAATGRRSEQGGIAPGQGEDTAQPGREEKRP